MNLKELKQNQLKGGYKRIMETKIKQEKGITLIALVITIVVLLILAGVSINAVFSDNGIINRAKEAQNKMDQAVENDQKAMNELSNWLENQTKGTNGKDTQDANVLKKQITNDETKELEEDTDLDGEDFEINFKVYEGNSHTILNIKKLEILSGSTIKNIDFTNCYEVIIYSDAVLENVQISGNYGKITIYSGAKINYCTFKEIENIKIMGATVDNCTFEDSCDNVTFENCIVDGSPYSN